MATAPGELTNTLVLALSQCQDQVRTIQEQSVRIERLQRENERLRKELQDAKQEPPAVALATKGRVSGQLDDLFHRNVEAQAEIHKLKRKLKSYKEKANGRLAVPISSPLSLPTPQISSPKQNQAPSAEEAPGSEHEQSPPRKRTRLNDTGVLHEIPTNTAHSCKSSTAASKKSDVEKQVAAIHMIAEDGEDYVPTVAAAQSPRSTLQKENSVYRRLGGLLGAPSPSRAPLARPKSKSPSKETPPPSTRRAPGISNIKHISSETPPFSARTTTKQSEKRHSGSTPEASSRAISREISSTGRTSLRRSFGRDPEDEEPLRARPVTRLSLRHFKPNPRWLDSHGMSYDEFLHGPNADRIKTLAETLPKLPGQARLSDDEILFDFLGPGSEPRVASLTELAKKNLLAEAKLKRVAQSFGKVRADYDREQDPPGFWSTDMPGTQEDEENKEKARKMEREEVKQRYEDALRGHGRWNFADE